MLLSLCLTIVLVAVYAGADPFTSSTEESARLPAVLANPAFASNPFATIRTHTLNNLALINKAEAEKKAKAKAKAKAK